MMKVGAKAGDRSMQLNLGYFYDTGRGVRRDRERAMYWYRRAYRRGDASAANNIGTIYRDEKRWVLALRWFGRAVDLGDPEANLAIAKILMSQGEPRTRVRGHLKKVLVGWKRERVCENSFEEATALLKQLS